MVQCNALLAGSLVVKLHIELDLTDRLNFVENGWFHNTELLWRKMDVFHSRFKYSI